MFTHVLHLEIVFRAANDLELFQKLSYKVLQTIEQEQPFDGNPLYAILHEPLYCQGCAISLSLLLMTQNLIRVLRKAANWSASRILQNHNQFSWAQARTQADDVPVYFTGEMVSPPSLK